MNKTLGLQLIAYSLLIAGLSFLVHYLAPTIARITLITGLAGGALCFLWGLLAVMGNPRKLFSILTVAPIFYVLLGQAIMNWRENTADVPHRLVAAPIIALMCLLTLVMLMRIAYAGMAMGAEPDPFSKQRAGGLSQK